MSMPRVLLLLMVLVVATSACASPSVGEVVQRSSDGRFEQVVADDVRIWRHVAGSGDGHDVLVMGALGYADGCGAFLDSEEVDQRYPVVWPAGTDIERADPLVIRLPDGTSLEDGQTVSGGGGYATDSTLVDDGCADSGETAIFNASADLEVVAATPPPSATSAPALAMFDRCTDLEEPPPSPDGPLSDDPDVAAAQQARAAVALPSDIATVEALLSSGEGDEGWPLGYPHTEEELQAIMARNGDVDQLAQLQEWAASTHPDTWAGLWLDQARGGVVTVAFTADVDARVAEIEDRYGLEVRGVEADFTAAELDAAQDRLGPAMQQHAMARGTDGPQPGDLTSTAVHAPTNRVQVGMYTDDEEAQQRLAELVDPAMVCLDIEEVPTVEDAVPASWAPSAGAHLSAGSTAIALDVIERACASATPADGRIVVRGLSYRQDAVVVTLGVIPLPGANDCPGNPVTPFTLELDEPLGDRQLLDGAGGGASPPTLDR